MICIAVLVLEAEVILLRQLPKANVLMLKTAVKSIYCYKVSIMFT